jgi:hypothetical protein
VGLYLYSFVARTETAVFFYHEFVWWCGFVTVYAQVEVNDQSYFPAALVPGKNIPVPID